MELKDICLSFETAKKLHEAGMVVESYFKYVIYGTWENYDIKIETKQHPTQWFPTSPTKLATYFAPTAEEFDLPDVIILNQVRYKLRISKAGHHWIVNWFDYSEVPLINYDKLGDLYPDNDHKLCEVIASVVLKLKEVGYADNKS